MPYKRIRESTEAAIKAGLFKHPEPDGCWDYTGKGRRQGYGFLHRRDEECFIHRRAWIEVTGDTLTLEDVIAHTCDRRICCRNDDEGVYVVGDKVFPRRGHLFKCTRSDNAADRDAKGRHALGAATGVAKLTDDQVRDIRARFALGSISQRSLSIHYGVNPMTISRIVRRQLWRHVE